MNIKARLAALEKVARDKGRKSIDGPQPTVRADYVREDGTFDHVDYRTAADHWSNEVFGKTLDLVAE
ncbi:hypothetical protein [Pantoea dispersa]|uniref:hypothetical protein n=1 Tax=Pantoea dispersa TaxID=59814 RepID=UPI001F529B47|nr:hypothetical protein [Pantoea dispersa]MCI1030176.1 hypothetical protein [Pantoea dispersa]